MLKSLSAHEPVIALSRALLRLAALFHDLGKASVAFQTKLQNGGGAEVLRHDLLSFVIVAESLWHSDITEEGWLERLSSNPQAACSCANEDLLVPPESVWLSRIANRLVNEKGVLVEKRQLRALDMSASGLLTVLWLVLTHHRLPAGDDLAEQLDAGRHMNFPFEDSVIALAPMAECLKPHSGEKPWENADWLRAVSSAAADALSAFRAIRAHGPVETPPFFWIQVAAHLLRPALILSDHLGSMQADRGGLVKDAFAGPSIYANLHGKRHAGDTLHRHLTRVADLSTQMSRVALAPSLAPTTSLPATSPALHRGLPDAYAWQETLGDACASAREHGPVFASIIAETGAGKTIAGARAMHNLSPSGMRFTLALGLRSLTWQSANSMLEDAEISAADLTVAVGQPQTLGLDDKARDNQLRALSAPRLGSESADGHAPDTALSNDAFDASWLEGVCSEAEATEFWGKPALALLSAPVLACTVDHLVAAVSLVRGGDAKLFLRQTSSDLLLDEIDSYSATDLQSLGKLTFVAGLHGKNVVLMSATMSPAVQNGLFAAWRAGLVLHSHLKSQPLAFGAVFAANSCPPRVLVSPDSISAAAAWQSFAGQVSSTYAAAAAKGARRQMTVHQLKANSTEDAFPEIAECGLRLHEAHHCIDPATGIRVSVGFVRFNTAKNAWAFSRYLSRRPEPLAGQADIRFITYHSKFPRNYLGVLDATLKQLTKRKSEAGFLATPALRAALDASTSKDLVVLVSTTTLIETGRDFDFDWAVLEPRSVRGEVQAAGRVRRHRWEVLGPGSPPNIIMLSTPLKALDRPTSPAWGRPGIEDCLPSLRVTPLLPAVFRTPAPASATGGLTPVGTAAAPSPPAGRVRPGSLRPILLTQAVDVLPVGAWTVAVDAQPCLVAPSAYEPNRIGYLEHAAQALNLTERRDWNITCEFPPSLPWYLTSFGPLNAVHARETPFRGSSEATALFVPRAGKIEFYDEATGKYILCSAGIVSNTSSSRALIPDLSEQAALLATSDKHIICAALRCEAGLASFKQLTWDPQLGFLE